MPVEPEVEPLELPEPMLPLVLPLVLPPVLPAEGVLGDVVLDEPLLLGVLLVPPLAAPALLKCASHSAREIWPSLLVSTAEKLGAELPAALLEGRLLDPDAALPPEDDAPDEPLDMPDEPLELAPPAAEGDVDLSLLVLDEELCASATLDSANSAAAVAALTSFSFNIGDSSFAEQGWGKLRPAICKTRSLSPTLRGAESAGVRRVRGGGAMPERAAPAVADGKSCREP